MKRLTSPVKLNIVTITTLIIPLAKKTKIWMLHSIPCKLKMDTSTLHMIRLSPWEEAIFLTKGKSTASLKHNHKSFSINTLKDHVLKNDLWLAMHILRTKRLLLSRVILIWALIMKIWLSLSLTSLRARQR